MSSCLPVSSSGRFLPASQPQANAADESETDEALTERGDVGDTFCRAFHCFESTRVYALPLFQVEGDSNVRADVIADMRAYFTSQGVSKICRCPCLIKAL